MTIKELKMMLQFYPENAEIFVQDKNGRVNTPENMLEGLIEQNPNAVVITVKESSAKLKAV